VETRGGSGANIEAGARVYSCDSAGCDRQLPRARAATPDYVAHVFHTYYLADKMFCTGFRRCARPVRALRPPPVRCTPYASQIPRRRCSTSTGRSVSPQRLPPSPPPADLCPPPMDLVLQYKPFKYALWDPKVADTTPHSPRNGYSNTPCARPSVNVRCT
jgi:hypothetical protein